MLYIHHNVFHLSKQHTSGQQHYHYIHNVVLAKYAFSQIMGYLTHWEIRKSETLYAWPNVELTVFTESHWREISYQEK